MKREEENNLVADIAPYQPRNNKVKIHVFNLDGKYLRTFPSVAEGARELKIKASGIVSCLKGKSHRAGNYMFRKAN